jgi:hypothetical protein
VEIAVVFLERVQQKCKSALSERVDELEEEVKNLLRLCTPAKRKLTYINLSVTTY